MGATFNSIQVRADSQEAVAEALSGLLKEPAYVSPPVGGWVGVYPEDAEATDALSAGLSLRLATAVLDWSVYDSDVFCYSLYEGGTLRDEFNSAPGYFDGMLDEEDEERGPEKSDPARVQGDPQALLPYCVPGTTLAAIQEVLHPAELAAPDAPTAAQLPDFLDAGLQQAAKMLGLTADALRQGVTQRMREKYTFAEHQAADLAGLLGMDEQLTSVGVSDSEPGGRAAYTKDDFRLVGNAGYSQQYKDDKLWSLDCLGRPENLSYWLQRGADPNTRDRSGQPLVFHHLRFPNSVETLLAAGADVNMTSTRSPHYPEIWHQYEAGVTALMVAARLTDGGARGVENVVRLLLDAGADVHARSEAGRTALAEALKMTDPAKHQGRLGRQQTQVVLEQDAAVSACVVEMLRAAGATE